MADNPPSPPQPSVNGDRWASLSFGPAKFVIGSTAAALVFVAFGWSLYAARQDTLAAQELCRQHIQRLEDRIEDLHRQLRGLK
jgi:hypothetical protein